MLEPPAVPEVRVTSHVTRRLPTDPAGVRLAPLQSDRLNSFGNGIRDEEHVAPRCRETVLPFAQSQSAQASTPHLPPTQFRERRCVWSRHIVATERIRR